MRRPEKIRVAALQAENTDAPCIVTQRHRIKASHSARLEVLTKLGTRLFARRVDLFAILPHVDNFSGKRRPLQDFI